MRVKIIFGFILTLYALPGFAFRPEVFRSSQLNELLAVSTTDQELKLERLSAKYFHHILNQYRQFNKLDTLAWDELLWLTAMNHCTWMIENKTLSHTQREKTRFFTGTSPGRRVKYVTGKSLDGYGENALYHYQTEGSDVDAQAKTIAQVSFEQWKSSPGHNENMLSPYGKHGAAFMLADGVCWAVDLFAYGETSIIPIGEENNLSVEKNSLEDLKLSNNTSQYRVFNKLLRAAFPAPAIGKLEKVLYIASQAHADYLLSNTEENEREYRNHPKFYARTPYWRLIKASGGRALFQSKPIENSHVFVFKKSQLNPDSAMLEIKQWVDSNNPEGIYAVGIEQRKMKDQLLVSVVISGYN